MYVHTYSNSASKLSAAAKTSVFQQLWEDASQHQWSKQLDYAIYAFNNQYICTHACMYLSIYQLVSSLLQRHQFFNGCGRTLRSTGGQSSSTVQSVPLIISTYVCMYLSIYVCTPTKLVSSLLQRHQFFNGCKRTLCSSGGQSSSTMRSVPLIITKYVRMYECMYLCIS